MTRFLRTLGERWLVFMEIDNSNPQLGPKGARRQ
jgi:hypothetical protein